MRADEAQARAHGSEQHSADHTMRLGTLAREIARRLAAGGVEGPDREARLLLELATGLPPSAAVLDPDREIDAAAGARLDALLARRLGGEPIARLACVQEFYGRRFLLGPETLVPRADTETVVDAVLAAAGGLGTGQRPLRILDLGTGSGCLLVTLLAEIPGAIGIGVDRSLGALCIAAENARRLGVADRALLVAGDWHEAIVGPFDVVVSNPPYVRSADIATLAPEVRSHDPRAALDGGTDGLDCYRVIAAGLSRIAPSGAVFLEVGMGQGEDVARILAAAGAIGPGRRLVIRADLSGVQRCVAVMPQ